MQKICTTAIILIAIYYPYASNAVLFFQDDFEEVTTCVGTNRACPIWSWKSPFNPSTNIFGMPYGVGDIYERNTDIKHRGSYSLKLNFAGRNGQCNTCGQYAILDHVAGLDNSTFFVDDDGGNLALLYNQPDIDRPVFNRSDYWSRWIGTSVANKNATNDRLNVILNAESMGGRGENDFDEGDDVVFYRKCGEDGNIGSNVNRRSDCDFAINYLKEIISSNHPPGGSIFRRLYFYFSDEGEVPDWGIKLGYFHALGDQSSWTTVICGDFVSGRNGNIHIDGSIGFTESSNPKITRGEWWYFEEQFKRESSDLSNNGEYRMWYAKAGMDPGNPKIEKVGLDLHQISTDGTGMSVIGNWQHWNDATAKVYFDDVVIADERIGVTSNQPDPTPPASPANLTVR